MKKRISFMMILIVLLMIILLSASAPANAEASTFKAVYDITDGNNILTFYYDELSHEGTNITVYNDLPVAATSKRDWGYYKKKNNVKAVVIHESVKNYHGLTSTAYMLSGMQGANSISGAEYLDVSNVTNMSGMFDAFGGPYLAAVPDVSKWNTGKVTDMSNMFSHYGAYSTVLTKAPDVSEWNTGKVTDMSSMFRNYGSTSSLLAAVPDVSKLYEYNT